MQNDTNLSQDIYDIWIFCRRYIQNDTYQGTCIYDILILAEGRYKITPVNLRMSLIFDF